jgi:hypothetical protein
MDHSAIVRASYQDGGRSKAGDGMSQSKTLTGKLIVVGGLQKRKGLRQQANSEKTNFDLALTRTVRIYR